MAEKELQEKILAYRILEARAEAMMRQSEQVQERIAEIESTLKSIEELEKSDSEVLFPIGSAAYIHGKVIDGKKVIVEVGAGVALEKTTAEAKDTLDKRKKEMQHAVSQMKRAIKKIYEEMSMLGPQIESLSKKNK